MAETNFVEIFGRAKQAQTNFVSPVRLGAKKAIQQVLIRYEGTNQGYRKQGEGGRGLTLIFSVGEVGGGAVKVNLPEITEKKAKLCNTGPGLIFATA